MRGSETKWPLRLRLLPCHTEENATSASAVRANVILSLALLRQANKVSRYIGRFSWKSPQVRWSILQRDMPHKQAKFNELGLADMKYEQRDRLLSKKFERTIDLNLGVEHVVTSHTHTELWIGT